MTAPQRRVAALVASAALAACASQAPVGTPAPTSLAGTSWRLVQVNLPAGTRPAIERSRYTIGFSAEGVLNVRFDCNRGRGSWKSAAPGQLEFGPLALTRAMCPVGSLHDELVRQWANVRSYQSRDGRLFLTLMDDGGTIEFEPSP